jgi:hypothetical protein
LSESDITRERLALEGAIRRIEAEEARRVRLERMTIKRPAVAGAAQRTPVRENRAHPLEIPWTDRLPAATPEPPPAAEAPPQVNEAETTAAQPTEAQPTSIKLERVEVAAPKPASPSGAPPAPADAAPEPASTKTPSPPRDLLADADRPLTPRPLRREQPAKPQQARTVAEDPNSSQLDDVLRKLRERSRPNQSDAVPPWPPLPGEPPRDKRDARNVERSGSPFARPTPDSAANDAAQPLSPEHDDDALYGDHPSSEEPHRRLAGMGIKIVIAVVVLAVLGALAAVGYRERDSVVALYHLFRSAPPAVTHEQARTTPPKIEDRVGSTRPGQLPGTEQSSTSTPATQPPPAVAQRVVLYEEDPNDPAGKRYVGSVIWRTETVSPGPGLAPELAVKANIEIPERHVTMTFSMVRNTDTKLPASHTIDIRFNLPPAFSAGGVANVPGILMKQAEQTRGVPLAGIAVKVTENVFLIGLSSVDSDVQRNTQLLKDRPWFDIPIVYANGSRAILAVEKGTPGERAFNDAFTAWGRSGTAAR